LAYIASISGLDDVAKKFAKKFFVSLEYIFIANAG
jgi:hypothetical protein